MKWYYYLQSVQDFLADGKSQNERRFGESFKGPVIFFDALIGYLTKLRERQSTNSSICKEIVTKNLSRICFDRGWIWEEKILTAEIEELEKLDASETYTRRLNAKEVLITQRDEQFVSPMADGSAKLSGRNCEFQELTLRRESTVRRENLSGESHGDREEIQPEETKGDAEARKDFLSIQGDFMYRHHIEPTSSIVRAEKRIISYSTE